MSSKASLTLPLLGSILTTACGVGRTPATALDANTASPTTREVRLPSDTEALREWQLPPSSPWSRYEKVTLLTYLADAPVEATMPDIGALEVVARAKLAASRVAAAGVPLDTMWVVDLRGAASVAFGATLSQEASQRVAPVMTFNNWPAENEVVPAEQTLAALVAMRPQRLPPGQVVAAPVFLLDAWRLAMRETTPDPSAVDNRYILLPTDFPDAATLRAHGIRRVVYVVEDRSSSATEEDDFNEVALAYQDAGIPIALVDLAQLSAVAVPPADGDAVADSWDSYIDDWEIGVRERATVWDDRDFYGRARGGFGGVRAAPGGGYAQHGGRSAMQSGGAGLGGGRAFSGASPHVSGGRGG